MQYETNDNGHGFQLRSAAIRAAYDELGHFAVHGRNCIIFGPTGAGKEYAARHYHAIFQKHRPGKEIPFVALNCGCLSRELAMSELFGHEKGAFTGAMHSRDGAFVRATGGVLFLDEIGELQEEVQAFLLRALGPDGTARKLGSDTDYPTTGVTVICATERPPGAIRPSLLSRLQMQVFISGANERQEDLPGAVSFFVRRGLTKCMDLQLLVSKYTDTTLTGGGDDVIREPGVVALGSSVTEVLLPLVGEREWPCNFRAIGNAIDAALVCADRPDTLSALRENIVAAFNAHADRYSTVRAQGGDWRAGSHLSADAQQDIAKTHPDLLHEIVGALPHVRNRMEVAAQLARFLVSNSARPFVRAEIESWFPSLGLRAVQKCLAQCVDAGIMNRSGKKGETYTYTGQQLSVQTEIVCCESTMFPLPAEDNLPSVPGLVNGTIEMLAHARAIHISCADAAVRRGHAIAVGHRVREDHRVYYLRLQETAIEAFLTFVESLVFGQDSRKALQQAAADLDDDRARVALCAGCIADGVAEVSDTVVILDGIEACYGSSKHLLAGWMVRLWPSVIFILTGPKLDNDLQDASGHTLIEQTLS